MTNQSTDYCSLIVHKRRTVSAEKRVAIICWSVSSAECLVYPVSAFFITVSLLFLALRIMKLCPGSPKNVSLRSVKQKVKISCFKFQRTDADRISSSVVWRNQLNLLS